VRSATEGGRGHIGSLRSVSGMTERDQITEMDVVADPERLAELDLAVLAD